MSHPGIKCVVAASCLNGLGERVYEGGGDLYLQVPAWTKGDRQMTDIHLEANARQQCVVLFRRIMQDSPDCLPKAFREAFAKNDWQVKVRVIPYERQE